MQRVVAVRIQVEMKIADRLLSIESGKFARQADGAVVVQYGDVTVLATVVAVPDMRNVPFLPLSVEYREKQYAVGQFPGGIIKREGRLTTKETLTCRMIDRPIRPLFPKDYHQEIQIMCSVLSADDENDPDVQALVAASAALSVSDIPFDTPIAACRLGLVNDEFVINPTYEQRGVSELDIVVSSTEDSVVMVTGSAAAIPEDDLLTAIQCGHDVNVETVRLIKELAQKCGKPKRAWEPLVQRETAVRLVKPRYYDRFLEGNKMPSRPERAAAIRTLREEAIAELCNTEHEDALTEADVRAAFDEMEGLAMREQVVRDGRRVDGRALDQVRGIECEVGCLLRTHGSALFTRGETQALVVGTLGTVQDEQRILDPLVEEPAKKFMLHYNFPPFSVGEVKPERGPGRRDIGHGELAEGALQSVLPEAEEFPYTVRIVSDILESNGSSSMASVCGGTLCLMDAGVPIKNPVAGIAIGLVKEGDQAYVLTDIAGAEDHHGDMDLKVAGTQHGITAIQMDLKVAGIGMDILRKGLDQARKARMEILRTMLRTLAQPRANISPYAPVLIKLKIDVGSIGKLIGPGGKTIKGLEENYQCNIEVEDDGTVTVSSKQGGAAEEAAAYIGQLGREIEIGAVYDGVVTDVKDFGAIVELFPGTDGLCHISQLDDGFVREVADVCKIGDRIKVKVLSVENNKVRLSRKAALKETKPD
ncbi:MAG: polyribonucleotide nucleotidyltransferase [Candidatus Brocadiae bacterium]|nr:polyribonucleotide nucleotidyltransferase [Candidatus Brocadiia bacterium]